MSEKEKENDKNKDKNKKRRFDEDDGLSILILIHLFNDVILWLFRGFGKMLDAFIDLFY